MAGCEDTTAAVTATDEIRSALLRVIDLVNNSINSQPTSRPTGSTSIVDDDDEIPPLPPPIIPHNRPSIYRVGQGVWEQEDLHLLVQIFPSPVSE